MVDGGRLFFIVLDLMTLLPKWLPEYHVRYNWEDFGVEQAVGAIKLRVLDNVDSPHPLHHSRERKSSGRMTYIVGTRPG